LPYQAQARCAPTQQQSKENDMKHLAIAEALLLAGAAMISPVTAQADGCLKGAVVGGVAGHLAGHHGLLGAGAGCLIGRHEANKRAREEPREEHRERHDYSDYR
jgi:hypothetical protein